jgi:hypothetical protein
LGIEDFIPWSMLLINLVAASATVYVLSRMLAERGVNPYWALVPLLTFNYLIGVRMDLNEPLAYGLALAGLWAFDQKRLASSAALFALAGLGREIALVFPVALALWLVLERRWREAWIVSAAGVMPYLIWAVVVRSWLGVSPFATPLAKPLLIPFAGMAVLEGIEGRVLVGLWAAVPAALAAIAAIVHILRRRLNLQSPEAVLLLANCAIIAVLPVPTWIDPLAVLRLSVGLILTLLLWLARIRPSWMLFVAGLWVPSLLLMIMIPGFML